MSSSMQLRLLRDRRGCLRSSLYLLARLFIFTLFVPVQNTILAQAPEGVVRGVVNDVTGAVVTKTSLRVSQTQFGGGRVVGTDAYGQYYITNLEPGDYEIEAFAPGFNTEVKHVTLLVGDHLTINFRLRPGSVDQQVQVRGEPSGVNTSEFAVKGSVSQSQIQNLPLNGLSTTLLPGINRHNLLGQGLSESKLQALVAQYNAMVEAGTRTITNPDGTQSVIRPRTPFNQIISPIVLPGGIRPGDSFISQDIRLSKKFNIKEKVTLSLIGEVFNALNVANLTGYSNVLNQPNYGQPSARAGQAFGTGGPRAFQVASRVEF